MNPSLLRKILFGFAALFLAAAAFQCTRALVSGVVQEPGARRQIGRRVAKADDPQAYWTVVGINAGGGLLLGGLFIGLALYIGRRKGQAPPLNNIVK